jgi:hypothetical protein
VVVDDTEALLCIEQRLVKELEGDRVAAFALEPYGRALAKSYAGGM